MSNEFKIEIKKAYKVKEWGEEIVEGDGFHLKFIEWWEKDKGFFRETGKDEFYMVDAGELFYSLQDAEAALKRAVKQKLAYYEKQLMEAQEKIKKLTSI